MEGWIKIHYKFLSWEWFQDDGMVRLFINLLLRANYQPKKWKGMVIERGQLVTGRKQLCLETGLSEQTIRTCLQRLEDTGEIIRKPTNKFSIVTICNYDTYQYEEKESSQQLTNNQPTTNQQLTTTSEYKKERIYKKETSNFIKLEEKKVKLSFATEQKNMQGRSDNFYQSLVPYVEIYGKEMIRAFYDYWTEPNRSKTKMKFELERTWDTKRRLNTWSNRDKKNINIKSNGTEHKQQQQQERANEILELNRKLSESDSSIR